MSAKVATVPLQQDQKRIPVFTWKEDDGQVGNGIYKMYACFQTLGVHVPFSFEAHSENEYLQTVGKASACDDSCQRRKGHLEDFGRERHDSSYGVARIIEVAEAFKP